MSSRHKILEAIGRNKPSLVQRPQPATSLANEDMADLSARFSATLKGIGGEAVFVNSYDEIREELNRRIPSSQYLVNVIAEIGAMNQEINISSDAHALEGVYHACVAGTLGVAENAAIWVDERQMVNRLLPFICQHLSLVIRATDIVSDMHSAYERIKIDKEGYGVFIAGPSKTADIEQSLVIGAHGARSLTVYLLK